MEERSISLSTIIICGVIALLSAIGTVVLVLCSDLEVLYKGGAIFDLVALFFAFFYLAKGYGKAQAKYYKISMLFNALNALFVTAVAANEKTKHVSIIMCAICFGLILLLALGENLGMKKSLIICLIVVFIRASGLISQYIITKNFDPVCVLVVSQLVLALMILACTLAKYEDKQARGTK